MNAIIANFNFGCDFGNNIEINLCIQAASNQSNAITTTVNPTLLQKMQIKIIKINLDAYVEGKCKRNTIICLHEITLASALHFLVQTQRAKG